MIFLFIGYFCVIKMDLSNILSTSSKSSASKKGEWQSQNYLNVHVSTVLRRNRKRGVNSEMIELFLWLTLMAGLGYLAVPKLAAFTYYPFSSDKQSQSESNFGDDAKVAVVESKGSTFNIQLTLQLYEIDGNEIDRNEYDSSAPEDSDNVRMKILADDQAKRFIVPKKLRFSHLRKGTGNKSILSDGSNNDQEGNRKMLRFVCSAPFPIEFKYEGHGNPLFTVSVEKRASSEDTRYVRLSMYIIILSFASDLPKEIDSGRYICQAVESSQIDMSSYDQYVTGNDERSPKHLDMFVPGSMKLLNRSPNIVNDDTSGGSHTTGSELTVPILTLYHNIAVDGGGTITLPCGASDPASKVSLYLKTSEGFESKLNEAINGPISYDYVKGFKFPVQIVKNMMRRFPGPYFACRADDRTNSREVTFSIELTDGSGSQVTPNARIVTISPSLKQQRFECQADEQIFIKWLDGPPPPFQSNVTTLSNNTVLYKVSFIATPSQYLSGNSTMTKFQCVRSQDGLIIHTWKWIRDGVTKPSLKYNGKGRKLSCCTNNTTAGSLHAPQLLVKTCSTMVECQIKASFQPNLASVSEDGAVLGKARLKDKADGDASKTCSAWTIPNYFQAGLIMCNDENRDPSWEKDVDGEGDEDSLIEEEKIPPVLVKWNDDVVILRNNGLQLNRSHLKQLTSIRVSNASNSGNRLSGHPHYIRIECLASTMLFAKGFRWTMHMRSGKVITNVQRQTTWEGEQGIISYREKYQSKTQSIRGILQIRKKEYTKPFLAINEDRSSKSTVINRFARLQMANNIGIVKCEIPLWNDTNIWIENFVDV